MAFNPFRLEVPDLPQPQGWVNMGEDDQPIDAGPAASAFKQRFMSPRPMAKPHVGEAMPHGGGEMAPHIGGDMGGHEAALGDAEKPFKSL